MTTSIPDNRVFLSYAHENLDMVRRIYAGLKKRKINVWFDKEDLRPGSWKRQIEKAIPKSRYFIICISEAALKKTGDETPGFQDEELQQAYEIARVQPEDVLTIVPVRLEDCGRGDNRLSPYQQYDLFNDFEDELDRLAVNLGGVSLDDKLKNDKRSEEKKIVETLYNKGVTLYYAGELTKSLDVFYALSSFNPGSADVWKMISTILADIGRKKESKKIEKRAFEFYSCFISHSHKDKSFVRKLHNRLMDNDIQCWVDDHQLLPGDEIYEQVHRGINLWDKVLLCCSKHSLTSWWVDNEVATAFKKEQKLTKERKKKVLVLIPLNLDGYMFSDEWENGKSIQIKERVAADFTRWEKDSERFEVEFERLLRSLQTTGARETPPDSRL